MSKLWTPGQFIRTEDCQRWENGLAGSGSPAQLSLSTYILPSDIDATNGLNRAIAAAQALNAPCVLDVPPGAYVLSGPIRFTLSGNQSIHLRGGGSAVSRLVQTADADGIAATVGNYGPFCFDGGAFCATGLAFEMAAAASSTRTGLSVTTISATGNTGKPLVLDDLAFRSSVNVSRWGTGLYVEGFSNISYISRISSVYADSSAATAVSINGNPTTYTASIYLRDISAFGGRTGLVLGNYLQGVHVENFNSVNTPISVQCTPTAGINQEISFLGCYLMGKSIFRPSGTAALNSIRIVGSFFDPCNPQPGDTNVTFQDAGTTILSGNTFNGQTGAAGANQVGLYFGGGTGGDTLVTGNQFQNYGAGGFAGTALSIAATATGLNFVGNSFHNCPVPIKDLGAGSSFVATTWEGGIVQLGFPNLAPSTVARLLTAAAIAGTWPAGTGLASTFPSSGPTIGWNLSNGGGETNILLGRQGGVTGGVCFYSVGPDGKIEGGTFVAQVNRQGGLGLFGKSAPTAQPAAPTTLADVIAVLRGMGACA